MFNLSVSKKFKKNKESRKKSFHSIPETVFLANVKSFCDATEAKENWEPRFLIELPFAERHKFDLLELEANNVEGFIYITSTPKASPRYG